MALLDWVGTTEFNNYRVDQKAKLDATHKAIEAIKSELASKCAALQQAIEMKVTDSEEAARNAAESAVASEARVKGLEISIREALGLIEKCRDEASSGVAVLKQSGDEAKRIKDEQLKRLEESEAAFNEIIVAKGSISSEVDAVKASVSELRKIVEESKALPVEAEATKKLMNDVSEISDRVKDLLSHSMKRKGDIDDLHKEIIGYDLKEGEVTEHIDGLKDELDNAYSELTAMAEALEKRISGLVVGITERHERELGEEKIEFEELLERSNERVAEVDAQLKSLLPGALAAGLSAAYEKKKDEEAVVLEKSESSFRWAIGALVAVSMIPFSVDIYLLAWKSANIVQVIKDTPSMVISILPLYLPVLWFAVSSNKKINLSKRLIEEYTHKAVLGKTFSGLSNQIESLPREGAVKDELRTKLLFNLLQVSSENPGKLISNYDKSDHPLMEALEHSAKLADSMAALNKLPGFSSLAKKLGEKSKDIFVAEDRKVKAGIAAQDAVDGGVGSGGA